MLLRHKDVIGVLWVFSFSAWIAWNNGIPGLQLSAVLCAQCDTRGVTHPETRQDSMRSWNWDCFKPGTVTPLLPVADSAWSELSSSCPCRSLSTPESPKTSFKSQITDVSRDPVFSLISGSLQSCAGTIISMFAIIHKSWLLIRSRHGPGTVSVEIRVQPSTSEG